MNCAIPQLHDKPPRFLFWPFDQAMLAILGIGIGILFNAIVVGSMVSLLVAYKYGKLRGPRHPMYLLHWCYWCLGSWVLPCTALPPTWQREFVG